MNNQFFSAKVFTANNSNSFQPQQAGFSPNVNNRYHDQRQSK
jgi:hypothetical protein